MAQMIPVVSTAVKRVGYDDGALIVEWKSSGSTTIYVGVPERIWQQLQAADSKGRFIAAHLRGKYREA